MFEFIEDLDWNIAGIALIAWALCLLMIWKFFDASIMRLHLRIIMTIVMLPVCYFIVNLMANK